MSVAVTRALVPFQRVVQPLVRIDHVGVSLDHFADVDRDDIIFFDDQAEGVYGPDGRQNYYSDKGMLIDCFV